MTKVLALLQGRNPLANKIGLFLLDWVRWILPAFADVFADDVGEVYQGMLTMIVVVGVAATISIPWGFVTLEVLTFWPAVLLGLVIYLVIGLFYLWHEKSWG